MTRSFAIGTITPSGNRTVERVTQTICATFPEVTALFTRIPMTGQTGVPRDVTDPYDWPALETAATLLSHAAPDVICWNGSKGGDYGFDIDHRLKDRLGQIAGVPVVTSALAVLDLLVHFGARRLVLVTPYGDAGHAKASSGFTAKNYAIVAGRQAGLTDNLAYGSISPAQLLDMGRAAVADAQGRHEKADAVVYFCTNVHAAPIMATLEAETGLPVIDSTAAGVWACLKSLGIDQGPARHFGRMFSA